MRQDPAFPDLDFEEGTMLANWHTTTPGAFTITGEIDVLVADCLRDALAQHPELVTIDVSGVTFIDSAGIDAIVGAADTPLIMLVNPSLVVTRLLDLFDRHGLWTAARRVLVAAS